MNPSQVIESAAALIEKLATALVEGESTQADLTAKLASAQELTKVAADKKAAVAGLAKTAAASAYDSGLVRDEKSRDELAVQLLDHSEALEQLAKVAAQVEAPRSGHALRKAATHTTETADEVWERHVLAAGQY